jgi:3-deoxy-D-manno-octulosonic-acid transferase
VNPLWGAYRLASGTAGLVAGIGGRVARGEARDLWRERLGGRVRAGGVHAWIHAASMGETLAAESLARRLLDVDPAARLAFTTTSATGRERLRALGRDASLAPIDAPGPVRRFFERSSPRRLFVIETELWFEWLRRAAIDGVPAAFVSARLSLRSLERYRWLGRPLRSLTGGLAAVLCQTADDAHRWRALGAPAARVAVVGNLKADALPEPATDRLAARAALGLDPGRPLWVLGSVRPGEVAALAHAWGSLPGAMRARWQVAALPRHPHADADLRAEARRSGIALVDGGSPVGGAWRWDARLGVLAAWYAAADAAFVGGSLLPYGGHNPLEPAACGAAVLFGPHHGAQHDATHALEAAGAIVVAGPGAELARAVAELLGDDAGRTRIAIAGLAVVAGMRGAGARAVARLEEWGLWPV